MSNIHDIKLRLEGEFLILTLPPHAEGGLEHIVRIPIARCGVAYNSWGQPLSNQRGWQGLLSVLKAREQMKEPPKIGTKGSPTQYDLETMARALAETSIEPKRVSYNAQDLFNDLGLSEEPQG